MTTTKTLETTTTQPYVTTTLMAQLIRDILVELNQLALETAGIAPTNSAMFRQLQVNFPTLTEFQLRQRICDSQYQNSLRLLFQQILELKHSIHEHTLSLQILRRNANNYTPH